MTALFEFHVRLVPDGRVTGYIAHDLKVGDAVKVSGPLGSAYLRRKHEGPMLCVAGGTGWRRSCRSCAAPLRRA